MPAFLRHLRSLFGSAILVTLVYLALIDTPVSTHWRYAHWAASIAAAILAAWFFFTVTVKGPRDKDSLGKPRPVRLTPDQLREAMDKVVNRYSPASRKYFGDILFRLPRYLIRIDERATVAQDNLEMATTVTFRLSDRIKEVQERQRQRPAHEKLTLAARVSRLVGLTSTRTGVKSSVRPLPLEGLLLPVIRTEKGKHIDELIVTDNTTGQPAPTLSRYETYGLVALTLRTLIKLESDGQADDDMLLSLLTDVCNGGPIGLDRLKVRLVELRVNQNSLPELIALSDYLTRNYIIVAELAQPIGRHITVPYKHFIAFVKTVRSRPERWRARFGLAPNVIDTPPNAAAFQAQSYHLQLTAPPNQYIYDHWLERATTGRRISQASLEPFGPPYVRVYHEDGRTNAHCYIRRPSAPASSEPQIERRPPDIKSVIELREIPPGSLGAAAVVATAAAILTTFFTFTRIAINGPVAANSASALNSDIPAFLLALPAFTALLLGHWSDQTRLPRSSLSAYWGLLGTLFISLTAALLVILDGNRHLATERELGSWFNWKQQADILWLALSGIAITQAIYLMRRVRGEIKYYLSLPKRKRS